MSVGNRFEKRSLKIFSVSLSAKDRITEQYYCTPILLSISRSRSEGRIREAGKSVVNDPKLRVTKMGMPIRIPARKVAKCC